MQNPELVVGKSALYYDRDKVPYVTRVMVTKHIVGDNFIVSDFDNPSVFYEATEGQFTVEKDEDQPEQDVLDAYLAAYENREGA